MKVSKTNTVSLYRSFILFLFIGLFICVFGSQSALAEELSAEESSDVGSYDGQTVLIAEEDDGLFPSIESQLIDSDKPDDSTEQDDLYKTPDSDGQDDSDKQAADIIDISSETGSSDVEVNLITDESEEIELYSFTSSGDRDVIVLDEKPADPNNKSTEGNSEIIAIPSTGSSTPPIKENPVPKKPVDPGVHRIYGNDRIGTSIAIAKELKKELNKTSFDNIIITRSDKWQDALSGSYLASVAEAPILLVTSGANADVLNYIKSNLSADGTIYILGGNLAVSDKVESSLSNYGNVVRLSGQTSYDTNLAILRAADKLSKDYILAIEAAIKAEEEAKAATKEEEEAKAKEESKPAEDNNSNEDNNAESEGNVAVDENGNPIDEDGATANENTENASENVTENPDDNEAEVEDTRKLWDIDILVTTGKNFPDAISISALGKPILLVYETITNAQKAFLSEHLDEKSKIYIIGGISAVSEKAEKQLTDYGTPVRVAGSNRYTTATKVADTFFKDSEEVSLARGDIFPDAMVGGVLANAKGIPIILTQNDTGFETAYKYVYKSNKIKAVTVFGGSKAISDDAIGMKANGVRQYGFLTVGKKLFCTNKDGDLYKNQFFTFDGTKYAATKNGNIAKNGWNKIGDITYYFNDYAVHSISTKAVSILNEIGYNLKAAYYFATMPYYTFASSPSWGSAWFANYGFEKRRGDCYVMASTFYILAKTLGYDVTQVAGYVNTTRHRAEHSWTFIKHKDGTWIYDPEFYAEHRQMAFKIKNGDTRWYYNPDWTVMHM